MFFYSVEAVCLTFNWTNVHFAERRLKTKVAAALHVFSARPGRSAAKPSAVDTGGPIVYHCRETREGEKGAGSSSNASTSCVITCITQLVVSSVITCMMQFVIHVKVT
jgi:hypothetical protein